MNPKLNIIDYVPCLGTCLLLLAIVGLSYEASHAPFKVHELIGLEGDLRQGTWEYFTVIGQHLVAMTAGITIIRRSRYAAIAVTMVVFGGLQMLLSYNHMETPISTVSLLSFGLCILFAAFALAIRVGEASSGKYFLQLSFGMCISLVVSSMN